MKLRLSSAPCPAPIPPFLKELDHLGRDPTADGLDDVEEVLFPDLEQSINRYKEEVSFECEEKRGEEDDEDERKER
jgi:hypothetical protein